MLKTLFFGSILGLLISSSALALVPPPLWSLETFAGQYKAHCQGTGPEDYKGQWDWNFEISHRDTEPDSLAVYFTDPKFGISHWLFTFEKVGRGRQTKKVQTADMCNSVSTQATLKDMSLSGSEDAVGYLSCGPIATYHAHYRDLLVIKSDGSLRYDVNYSGYGGDYKFFCELK
jgi:hypothetical protein